MVTLSLGVGLVLTFLFAEITGLVAGGLIVPGYLALYFDQPARIWRLCNSDCDLWNSRAFVTGNGDIRTTQVSAHGFDRIRYGMACHEVHWRDYTCWI